MDRQLRQEIREDVQKAIASSVMQMQEQWLSADDLCKQFAMITPKLLKYHGDIFPRKRITMTGMNGVPKSTHWAYPRFEIAMNIANGLYENLKVMKNL